jgi:hypothetical protein
MKRIFWLLAAAAITITACNKPQYIIPIDDDEEEETPGEEEGFKEKTFVVNISLKEGVNNTYDGTVGTMPGKDILDFLELTQEEFYKGMGTCTTGSMSSSQSDNTVLFGVANKNSADDLKWIPSTSNNFGHWFGKDGAVITWGDEAYFFTESLCEWGASAPDADTYADMWNFTVGCFPGRTAAGETYKATEVFFVTSDDDVELYAYVEWNITIEAAEEVKLNVVGTQEVTFDTPFNNYGDYPHTPLVPEIDQAALQSAIGVSLAEADVYGVNPDGSFSLAPGKNFWFMTDGSIGGWGTGAGICINDDAGTNEWAWCMFPDESLGGQSLKGAIAFVNPTTLNAYVVKVTVNVEGIDFLNIDVLVSYEDGETVYTLNENNLAALAAALGVESVAAEEIGTTYPLKGINADGSVYEGGFTANNGYWYTLEGNVTDWAGVEAAGYVGAYIEYRNDFNFGCGMWEESGEQSTVKFGVGDAILTFNLTVDQPKAYETEEVGAMAASATQATAAGYGGQTIVLDYDAVCSTLGLTDEDFEAKFKITSTEGSVNYTAELPGGFWFNADNQICEWGDVNSAYYLNFKYGEALEDASAGKLQVFTGIRNDNATDADGNVTHACPAPGEYIAVVRMANIETMKHITLTVHLTITE